MQNTNFGELDKEEKELLGAAEEALQYAYNPYNSETKVGAGVRTSTGEIFVGSNIANASSTVNLCAERTAVAAANGKGHRDIVMIALIGTDEDGIVEEPVMPCGVCLQFMEELITINHKDITVIASNTKKDKIVKTSLKELLPFPYEGSGKTE